jgi:hypothetical protein
MLPRDDEDSTKIALPAWRDIGGRPETLMEAVSATRTPIAWLVPPTGIDPKQVAG